MVERTLGPSISWEPCEAGVAEDILTELARTRPTAFAGARLLHARFARLPFYANHDLVDVRILGVAGVERALLLHGPADTHWLDGQSTPVHVVNALETLALTTATVLDYVRFFLFAIRGEHGAFVVIEAPEEIGLAAAADADVAVAGQVASLRQLWTPLRQEATSTDGRFRAQATVAYSDVLYASTFLVKPDGEIEMVDDTPLAALGGVPTPVCPTLQPPPEEDEVVPPATKKSIIEITREAKVRLAESDAQVKAGSDLSVTEAFVSVLLVDAIRGALGHRLLQRFNTQSHPAGPIGQLARFVQESAPIIVIESDIAFVEDIVVGLLDPTRAEFPEEHTRHAAAVTGDDTRCWVDTRVPAPALHVISFHAYRTLWDAEWTAHQLAVGAPPVLIGCARRADVPEPLRRATDLILTLPRVDTRLFADTFRQVIGAPPPPRWRTGGADWVRYVVHSDFHAPQRLKLDPAESLDYLRERCQARIAQVSAADSLALKDLHGLGEARQVAEDLIADIAAARAGRIPWQAVDRGLLLVGAPGTGKTTLARAIARACDVKFIHASATQWQSSGGLDLHLRAMRETFSEARRYAPAIVFIDEIDSIGNRELFAGSNGVYQTEVVNALLEQVQGLDPNEPVIVIGATNYLEKIDPALRRAGRLDQVIQLPRPNVAALEQIFTHYLQPHRKRNNVGRDVRVKGLAQLAYGLTGADVEFFVRGAARRARKDGRKIAQADLLAEVTRRPRRADTARRLTAEDMRRVAVHEAGHALSALGSTDGAPELTFVSIIPRMDGSLGFTASMPPERGVMTRMEVLERMRTILAGRAAEEVVYGKDDISLNSGGGPTSDLAVATRVATSVVCSSGFGSDGNLNWTSAPTPAQARQVDALLRSSYRDAVTFLRARRQVLVCIADALVEKQELDGVAVRSLAATSRPASSVTRSS